MRHAVLTFLIVALGASSLGAKPRHRRASKPSVPKASHRKVVARIAKNAETHQVRKGETGAAIARAFDLRLRELMDLNPDVNLARLSLGQTLVVAYPSKVLIALAPLPTLPSLSALGGLDFQPGLPNQGVPAAPGAMSRLDHALKASPAAIAGLTQPVMSVEAETAVNAPFEAADPSSLDLLWPVETRTISSSWGPRMRSKVVRVRTKAKKSRRKRVRYRGRHRGLDLNAPMGTDVYAALDGRVMDAGRHRQYGNYITVDHGNGVLTLYAHHRTNFVLEGDIVRRGQKIAEVGRTGNSTGPHLHFELRFSGAHQNPLPFMNDVEEIPAELVAQNALVGEANR